MVTEAYNNHRYVSQVQKDKPRHEPTYNQNKVVGTVTDCDAVYIRTAPEDDAEPICTAKKNDILVVDKKQSEDIGDWYKVSAENGLGGYVKKDYITLKED